MQYGQPLEEFSPEKDYVYSLFTQYYNDPTMSKIKDVKEYSFYMAKIYALLGVEFRYLVAICHKDNLPIGTTEKLSNLRWISFQARTLPDDHKIDWHSYTPSRTELGKKIELQHHDDRQYIYKVEELPIKVILLARKRKVNIIEPDIARALDYNKTGTVITALETYQTIVELN